MGFLFTHVCHLLEQLEIEASLRFATKTNAEPIRIWFDQHRDSLRRGHIDFVALLSLLLPERRADLKYGIQAPSLERKIALALGVGDSRLAHLKKWTEPGVGVDLADCVFAAIKEAPVEHLCPLTIEEVDRSLTRLASTCRFSSPAIRSRKTDLLDGIDIWELYKRAEPREGKWLTRMILKDLRPVVIEPYYVYQGCHPFLRHILRVQDDLVMAGGILQEIHRDDADPRKPACHGDLATYLVPRLGVKVGRQTWQKARSIKNALDMCSGTMSCEKKLDGEYCQIHVDLNKAASCIQIFSKSGRDSTQDRIALHQAIRDSLRLGCPGSRVQDSCILEGELVVYSDRDKRILDFHQIRKHVTRAGSWMGRGHESQQHPSEHLMIVYYDALMVDGYSLLQSKHSERYDKLCQLVTPIAGRSSVIERRLIDCTDKSMAARSLKMGLGQCIVAGDEGLVLKPDAPYFDPTTRRHCLVKLKKEYIGTFGDVGDFAIVGARYDAVAAKAYGIRGLQWTHFYIGCLKNKDTMLRWGGRPKFMVTNAVELNQAQMSYFRTHINPRCEEWNGATSIELDIHPGIDEGKRPTFVFPDPPIFDIRCFNFDKTAGTRFWSPRFPVVSKIHSDRTLHEVISFDELQNMASKERTRWSEPEDSQELLSWIARLEAANPKDQLLEAESQATAMTPQSVASSEPCCMLAHEPEPSTRAPANRPSLLQAPQRGQHKATTCGKRPPSSPPQRNPKSRRVLHEDDTASGKVQSTTVQLSPTGGRRPLGHVSAPQRNSLSYPAPHVGTSSTMPTFLLKNTRPLLTTAPPPSTIPGMPRARSLGAARSLGSRRGEAGKCVFRTSCCLAKYSLLLAPCVSTMPWLTEDLLPIHGVTKFITDPRRWTALASNSTSAEAGNNNSGVASAEDAPYTSASECASTVAGAIHQKRKKKKPKSRDTVKIALVENSRVEARDKLIQQIEAAALKRHNGKRSYVRVYDWRLLEELSQEEEMVKKRRAQGYGVQDNEYDARFDPTSAQSVWWKHWVGLA